MNQTVFGNVNGTTEEDGPSVNGPPNKGKRSPGGGLGIDYGTKKKRQEMVTNDYGSCWDGSITNPSNPQVRLPIT